MRALLEIARVLSWRHAVASPLRAVLTALGVALGVAVVVGLGETNAAVRRAFVDLVHDSSARADLEIVGGPGGVDVATYDVLVEHPELVSRFAGRTEQTTILGDGRRVLALGIDWLGDQELVPFSKVETRTTEDPLETLGDPHAITIAGGLARELGLAVGSTLPMRTAHGMETMRVAAVLGDSPAAKAYGGNVVVLSLDAAQLLFDRPGVVDRIEIAVAKGVRVEEAASRLAVLTGTKVERPRARAERLAGMTASLDASFGLQALLAAAVAVFLIFNGASIALTQRRRELAIVQSMGATRAAVAFGLVGEALLLAALGVAAGIGLGHLVGRVVLASVTPSVSRLWGVGAHGMQAALTPALALRGVAVGFGSVLLGTAWPIVRAMQERPVAAMKPRPTDEPPTLRRLGIAFAAGLALVAAGLLGRGRLPPHAAIGLVLAGAAAVVPLLFVAVARPARRIAGVLGPLGQIGVEHGLASFARTASSVIGLAMAGAASMAIGVFTSSYEKTILDWSAGAVSADVVIAAGSPLPGSDAVPFDAPWIAEVARVPGVTRAGPVKVFTTEVAGQSATVCAIASELFFDERAKRGALRVVEGILPHDALVGTRRAVVSENFVAHTGLHVGDVLHLPLRHGSLALPIQAVIVDYASDHGLVVIDHELYREAFGDVRVDSVFLTTESGRADEVAASLRQRLPGWEGGTEGGLFVTIERDVRLDIDATVKRTLDVARAGELTLLILAWLGALGTCITSAMDRRMELSLLRSAGGQRRHVVAATMLEAAFLATAGMIVAAATAVPLSKVLVDAVGVESTGWSVPLHVPGPELVIAAIAVIVTCTLTAIPVGLTARHRSAVT